jgi:hypothetical protein
VSLENATADGLRSGFVLNCTNVDPINGLYEGKDLAVMFEAPEALYADYFMAAGLIKFFEEATNGTLKMVLVFAQSTLGFLNGDRTEES